MATSDRKARTRSRPNKGKSTSTFAAKSKSKGGRRKPGRAARSRANRRVQGKAAQGPRKAPPDPNERRARNRTLALLSLLAVVNLYVFVWRDDGGILGLSNADAAAIGSTRAGPLAPVADPVTNACGGDPVQIFAGLQDLLPVTTTLVEGRTLRLALMDRGIDDAEIDRIEAAIRSKVDLGLLGGSGAPVAIAMDRYGGVRALEIELAEGHLVQACRDGDGFSVRNIQHPLRSDVVVVEMTLPADGSLVDAVVQAGEDPSLARVVAEQLAHDVDFHTESRPADRIAVIVEKRWLGRSFHRYGQVLAIRYRGAAGHVAYYRYKPEGGTEAFFDRRGRPARRALRRSAVGWFAVPADARGLLVPTLEVVEGRLGAVYRLPEGAPVVAIADATVADAGQDVERGRWVDLALPDGSIARYQHLMRTVGSLEPGTRVEQGALLGLAGHSGKTPNDRLRLELWRDDEDGEAKTMDPLLLTAKGANRPVREGPEIPAARLSRFQKDVTPRRRALESALR